MRMLLTGAAGFIGTEIAAQAVALGVEVVGIDAMVPFAHATQTPPPGVQLHDVRKISDWDELLVGVDVVCHQAAMVGSGVSVADFPAYAAHNDLGTAELLAAMTRRRLSQLVLASSMVVYGEGRYGCPEHGAQPAPVRDQTQLVAGQFAHVCSICAAELDWVAVPEDARLDPRSAYAASKLAQEHYASAWARETGGSVIALRYHNVYGPGMPKDTPYSGVAALFRSAIARGEAPRVFEDGAQMRDFVHVSDVARANLVAASALDSVAGAFNVCSGFPISIREVASYLGSATGIAPIVTGQYRLGDVRHVVASPDRARELLGFTAQVSPASGLQEFASAPLRD